MKRTLRYVFPAIVAMMLLSIGGLIVLRLDGRYPVTHLGGTGANKQNKPRIIIISEPALTDGIPYQSDPAALEAYNGMAEQLAEMGMTVVDKEQYQTKILQEYTSPEMFYKGYTVLGLEKKTEYILVYRIEPQGRKELGKNRGHIKQARVNISAHIVNTASGEIKKTHHRNVMGEDKDTMEAAIRKAAGEAGKEVAKYLKKILDTKKRRKEYGN